MTQKKQVLQDLQVFFLIFNCQTPASLIHGAINAVAGLPLFYMKEMPQHYLLGPTLAGLIGGIPLFVLGIVLFVRMCKDKKIKEEV